MRVEEIRNALRAQPFTPFVLCTSYGREYPVRHPEFLAIFPGGRSIVVTFDEGNWDVLDLMHVSSLHFGDGRSRRTPRKGAKWAGG